MLTFRQFITESPLRTAAAVGITAKIGSLNRQVQSDKVASKAEKNLSSELAWLAGLVGLMSVTGDSIKNRISTLGLPLLLAGVPTGVR